MNWTNGGVKMPFRTLIDCFACCFMCFKTSESSTMHLKLEFDYMHEKKKKRSQNDR